VGKRIDTLTTTIVMEVCTTLTSDLVKINQRIEGLASLVGHFSSEDGKMSTWVFTLQQDYDSCIASLETTIATLRENIIPLPPNQRTAAPVMELSNYGNTPLANAAQHVGATDVSDKTSQTPERQAPPGNSNF
jgi:hypothetical protein